MENKLRVWKLIRKNLHENVPVMLLYVLESSGSSPGREGFCMAVNVAGDMEGSIGGGIMEHKFVELAKDKLRQRQHQCKVYKQIHDKQAIRYQSGMICSGRQSNFLCSVNTTDLETVNLIIDCLESNRTGRLSLSIKGIEFDKEAPEEIIRYSFQNEDDKDWLYEEKIGYQNHVHIIGAGHCALALSKILRMLDFYVHLYDNRSELKTFIENADVHEKLIVNTYDELKNIISIKNQYVVIMTVGYRTDDLAVRALMDKKFTFFGILGSKKKIEKMFAGYIKEGIDQKLLKKIHAPVGLQINSQTPEEIAISIAAEIIKVKNGG